MTKDLHKTSPKMVADLLALLRIEDTDTALDAGSGDNKVWFNSLKCEKYECELDEGCDFYEWDKPVDWVVGNPPFHESYKFFLKAAEIAKKGIAFLINNQAMNSMTPTRWEYTKEQGFTLKKLHVVNDKRWFGRYWFLVFTRSEFEDNDFVSWETQTY